MYDSKVVFKIAEKDICIEQATAYGSPFLWPDRNKELLVVVNFKGNASPIKFPKFGFCEFIKSQSNCSVAGPRSRIF